MVALSPTARGDAAREIDGRGADRLSLAVCGAVDLCFGPVAGAVEVVVSAAGGDGSGDA